MENEFAEEEEVFFAHGDEALLHNVSAIAQIRNTRERRQRAEQTVHVLDRLYRFAETESEYQKFIEQHLFTRDLPDEETTIPFADRQRVQSTASVAVSDFQSKLTLALNPQHSYVRYEYSLLSFDAETIVGRTGEDWAFASHRERDPASRIDVCLTASDWIEGDRRQALEDMKATASISLKLNRPMASMLDVHKVTRTQSLPVPINICACMHTGDNRQEKYRILTVHDTRNVDCNTEALFPEALQESARFQAFLYGLQMDSMSTNASDHDVASVQKRYDAGVLVFRCLSSGMLSALAALHSQEHYNMLPATAQELIECFRRRPGEEHGFRGQLEKAIGMMAVAIGRPEPTPLLQKNGQTTTATGVNPSNLGAYDHSNATNVVWSSNAPFSVVLLRLRARTRVRSKKDAAYQDTLAVCIWLQACARYLSLLYARKSEAFVCGVASACASMFAELFFGQTPGSVAILPEAVAYKKRPPAVQSFWSIFSTMPVDAPELDIARENYMNTTYHYNNVVKESLDVPSVYLGLNAFGKRWLRSLAEVKLLDMRRRNTKGKKQIPSLDQLLDGEAMTREHSNAFQLQLVTGRSLTATLLPHTILLSRQADIRSMDFLCSLVLLPNVSTFTSHFFAFFLLRSKLDDDDDDDDDDKKKTKKKTFTNETFEEVFKVWRFLSFDEDKHRRVITFAEQWQLFARALCRHEQASVMSASSESFIDVTLAVMRDSLFSVNRDDSDFWSLFKCESDPFVESVLAPSFVLSQSYGVFALTSVYAEHQAVPPLQKMVNQKDKTPFFSTTGLSGEAFRVEEYEEALAERAQYPPFFETLVGRTSSYREKLMKKLYPRMLRLSRADLAYWMQTSTFLRDDDVGGGGAMMLDANDFGALALRLARRSSLMTSFSSSISVCMRQAPATDEASYEKTRMSYMSVNGSPPVVARLSGQNNSDDYEKGVFLEKDSLIAGRITRVKQNCTLYIDLSAPENTNFVFSLVYIGGGDQFWQTSPDTILLNKTMDSDKIAKLNFAQNGTLVPQKSSTRTYERCVFFPHDGDGKSIDVMKNFQSTKKIILEKMKPVYDEEMSNLMPPIGCGRLEVSFNLLGPYVLFAKSLEQSMQRKATSPSYFESICVISVEPGS